MKKTNIILVVSGILLIALITLLVIKQNKPSFLTGKEVFYLNDASFSTAKVTIGDYVTFEEYQLHKTPPTTVEKVEQKIVNGKVVEVVFLGDIGVLGEKLDISYIDTETHLDEDRYTEYMAQMENNNSSLDNSSDDNITDNKEEDKLTDDKTDKSDDDKSKDDKSKDDKSDDDKSDDDKADDNKTDDDKPDDTTDNQNADDQNIDDKPDETTDNTDNTVPDNTIIRAEAVREFVSAQNSCQRMGYVIYAPENVTANTPILLFLHGIGQNGASYKSFIGAIGFIKYLVNGNWTPNVIIVAPICPGGSKWINETANINAMLNEVINTFGGNRNNMYIAGFSAGCDSITPIAKEIPFRGALYMAGYLGGVSNTVSTDEFLRLWSGKSVYYYRDSKYGSGGYGYQPNYVSTCEANAASYGVDFKHIDMHWAHRSSMIDAVLLPGYFNDANGNPCLDVLATFIK